MKTESIELLAPAKDLETGIAAINFGADAVYIGANRFGARDAAGNDLKAIESLINYAHKYWTRVYITLNTLLFDDEIPGAIRLAWNLYDMGIDALIVQDFGLFASDLPPIPIFASTQMHNHTPERVKFLQDVGFSRVILARELTIEQIQEIRQKTTIELESFVHGSLCVSYSGQCYMSYALGGRSGNRGQCAQPCRKPYRLVDQEDHDLAEKRYWLSLKDLNLSDDLDELLSAGIRSFKIEGRLKDLSYVKNVVGFYRKRLDEILSGDQYRASSSGKVVFDFTPDPSKSFNRTYSRYFLHGRQEKIADNRTPKSTGEYIGKVISADQKSIFVDSWIQLHNGDGLCYFDDSGNLKGSIINRVKHNRIYLAKFDTISVGTDLYRNHDHEYVGFLEKSKTSRKIDIIFSLKDSEDGFVLSVTDEDGNQAQANLACEKLPALNPEMLIDTIEKQLKKLGGTMFVCKGIRIDLISSSFIQMGQINLLRRDVLEKLITERQRCFPRKIVEINQNDVPYPDEILDFNGNVLNKSAETFYLQHGVTKIALGAETGLNMDGRKVMTTKYCLRDQLGACLKQKDSGNLKAPLFLLDNQGNHFYLRFDCVNCQMEIIYTANL